MANKPFFPKNAYRPGRAELAGKVNIAADASVSSVVPASPGGGFTAVRSNTGLYTVTFGDSWLDIESVQLTLAKAAAAELFIEGVAPVLTGAVVTGYQFRTIDNLGVATDTAAVVVVNLHFTLRYTSIS